jgi:peptidoglycan/xylan/chitin deacetylase (PgdA/CDA1 family)
MFDLTLTFDNGPDPETTPFVLDALARDGIKATFFVLGRKLAEPGRRALAERAHADGHWIGNHTWSHETPLGRDPDPDAPAREILRTDEAIGPLAHPDRLFRPFGQGGRRDDRLLSPGAVTLLRQRRQTCVIWNAVPRDWEDIEGWPARALAQCRERDWTLLVLHDLPTGAMRHLPRFIAAARAAGARFRQDFPADCVAMARGTPAPWLADIVAA